MGKMPFPDSPPTQRLPPAVPNGGISQQPPNLRFPNQVASATNASFSVVDGASKRPGTWFVRDMTAKLTGDDYRAHGIRRDQDEEYLVAWGVTSSAMTIFVEEIGGYNLAAFVSVTAAAQAYLDAQDAESGDIRMRTVADSTFVLNTLVSTALEASASYNIERSWRDYDVLLSVTTADGNYFKTEKDTTAEPLGYWRYKQDGITFAHFNCDTVKDSYANVGSASYWKTSGNNPMGFYVSFGRFGPFTVSSGATWTYSTATLARTGAFTDYDFRDGDHVFIGTAVTDSGATNDLAVGWYRVSSRTSANAIVLIIPSVSGGSTVPLSTRAYKNYAGSTVAEAYIGNEYECIIDGTQVDYADMQDVALEMQRSLRAAGAQGACVLWWGRGAYGAFQVTCPYRGANATIYLPKASSNVQGGATGAGDLTHTGRPFVVSAPTSQVFNGSGTIDNEVDTLDPTLRWNRVAAPMQSGAALDPDTMPVRMVRTLTSASKTITGNTLANPTVVTCAGHGLRNGQKTYWISSNSTPSLTVGSPHVATVIDDDHFSVPVNVTGAGTTGIFRRGAVFDVAQIDWNDRTSGDSDTNPAPDLFVQGAKIRDLRVKDNRLHMVGGAYIAASVSGDLFNFFAENESQPTDSDPIDLTVSGHRIANYDFAVPFRDGTTLFSLSGQQYDLSSDGPLTAANVRVVPTTAYNTRSVHPAADATELYFVGQRGCYSSLHEYRYDDTSLQSIALDVTAHVPTLLPENCRDLEASANDRAVFVVPEDDGDVLFVYRSFFSNANVKQQSAWTRYDFDDSYDIEDAAIVGDRCYLLTSTANIRFWERLPLSEQPDVCHYDDTDTTLFATSFAGPYIVHLDRKFYKIAGSGTWDGSKTTWDLGVQTPASTINRVVRLDTGQEYTLTGWTGTSVELAGVNLSAVKVILGCAYDFEIELNRPWWPQQDDGRAASIATEALIQRLDIACVTTGDIDITIDSEKLGTTITKSQAEPVGAPPASKEYSFAVIGRASDLTVTISSSTARPCVVASYQWTIDAGEGVN